MKLIASLRFALALASLSIAPLAAQDVLVVDAAHGAGADFFEVQDAVDAASDGDVILIRSGDYEHVTINGKGLTLQAEAGASVRIKPPVFVFVPALRVNFLTPSQQVFLRGISFEPTLTGSTSAHVDLNFNQAPVWFEDCDLVRGSSLSSAGALRADSCLAVTLTRCTVEGGFATTVDDAGISTLNTHVTLYDTTVIGPNGMDATLAPPTAGGPAVSIDDGVLFASGCTFTGGMGGNATFPPVEGAAGGDGLLLDGSNPLARLLDCTLVGGAGGAGVSGSSDGDDGLPSNVLAGSIASVPGSSRTMVIDSPVRAGQEDIVETFTGLEGDFVLFGYSISGQIRGLFLPLLSGELVVAPPLFLSAKGTIDGSGVLVSTVPTPPLGIGVEGLFVTSQAAFLDANGDGFYLGSPGTVLLLGAGL